MTKIDFIGENHLTPSNNNEGSSLLKRMVIGSSHNPAEDEISPVSMRPYFLQRLVSGKYCFRLLDCAKLAARAHNVSDEEFHETPNVKANQFVSSYTNSDCEIILIQGWAVERDVSFGESELHDVVTVGSLIILKNKEQYFLGIFKFLFTNFEKEPSRIIVEHCSKDSFIEALDYNSNFSSKESFFVALLSVSGILRTFNSQLCLSNGEGYVSVKYEKSTVKIKDLIAAGACKRGDKEMHVAKRTKYLTRGLDELWHLTEEQNTESVAISRRHLGIIPYCNESASVLNSTIFVKCSDDDAESIQKLWGNRKLKATIFPINHFNTETDIRDVDIFIIKRSLTSPYSLTMDEFKRLLANEKVFISTRKENFTIVYNVTSSEFGIKTHRNLEITGNKVCLSWKDRIYAWLSMITLVGSCLGAVVLLEISDNEGVWSAIACGISLLGIGWVAIQSLRTRVCIFPLLEKLKGRVIIDSWEKLLALSPKQNTDAFFQAGRIKWLTEASQEIGFLSEKNQFLFPDKKLSGNVALPFVTYECLYKLGIFVISRTRTVTSDAHETMNNRQVLHTHKFQYTDFENFKSNTSSRENWTSIRTVEAMVGEITKCTVLQII